MGSVYGSTSWVRQGTFELGNQLFLQVERQAWPPVGPEGVEAAHQIFPIFLPYPSALFLWSAFWTVFVADQFHLICLLISAIVILRWHAILFIFVSFRCFCLSYSAGLSAASGFAFRLECLSSCLCFECEIKRRWIPVKIFFSYEQKIGAHVNIPLTVPSELF